MIEFKKWYISFITNRKAEFLVSLFRDVCKYVTELFGNDNHQLLHQMFKRSTSNLKWN